MSIDWLKSFRGRTRRRISNHLGGNVDQLENITLLSPTPVGPKYRVNTYTTGDQDGASVAMDAQGNYIVVWESNGHVGLSIGVFAQRYNSVGEPIGNEFQIDTPPQSSQTTQGLISFVDVAMDADGDFVVVWDDDDSGGLLFRRFNSEAIAQGPEVRVNPSPDSDAGYARVAMDPEGDFVIAWNDSGVSYISSELIHSDIYARCYNSNGSPKGDSFPVHPPVERLQDLGDLALDEQGNFTVVWEQDVLVDTSIYNEVRGRRFDSGGTPLGDEFTVASSGENESFSFSSVAMGLNGDFTVTWSAGLDNGITTYAINANARLYSSNGSPKGAQFSIKSSANGLYYPVVTAMDNDGNFVAIWTENLADIRGQFFNQAGLPFGSEFLVSATLFPKQDYPLIAMAPSGNFVTVWRTIDFSGYGVFSQRFKSTHKSDLAVWRSSRFYLDSNHSGTWNGSVDDTLDTFGSSTDTPLVGDWNGDGYDDIGIWRNGSFYLDANGNGLWDGPTVDKTFRFGLSTDTPIVGDWNGDGKSDIGVWRAGKLYLDLNGNYAWNSGIDAYFSFGSATDTPIIGDWNADGTDDIGIWRAGKFYLDLNANRTWNSGVDGIFTFGLNTDTPLIGDWNGDGIDDIAAWRTGKFYKDTDGSRSWNSSTDTVTTFGSSADTPLIGYWRPKNFPGTPPAGSLSGLPPSSVATSFSIVTKTSTPNPSFDFTEFWPNYSDSDVNAEIIVTLLDKKTTDHFLVRNVGYGVKVNLRNSDLEEKPKTQPNLENRFLTAWGSNTIASQNESFNHPISNAL